MIEEQFTMVGEKNEKSIIRAPCCFQHIQQCVIYLPLALIRKARSEGIFYHALKPSRPDDEEELKAAVKCAFEKVTQSPEIG